MGENRRIRSEGEERWEKGGKEKGMIADNEGEKEEEMKDAEEE